MLRGLVIARDQGWDPHNILDIVDDRTLRALLTRCGIEHAKKPTLEEFFCRQRLIEHRDNLSAVVSALSERGIIVFDNSNFAQTLGRANDCRRS